MNDALQSSATLRNRVHRLIELADEQVLEAVRVLIEQPLSSVAADSYDAATLRVIHERRTAHLAGQTASYSVEESLRLIRSRKQHGL